MRSHRRRGPRLPPFLIAGFLMVIVAGGAWWLTRDRDGKSEEPRGSDSAVAADRLLDDPFGSDGSLRTGGETTQPRTGSLTNRNRQPRQEAAEAQSRERPPVVIAQGGGETRFVPSQPITIDEPRSLGESLAQTPTSTPTSTPTTPPEAGAGGAFSRAVRAAEHRLAARDPVVAARVILNEVLRDRRLSEAERSQVRARLTEINQELVFSAAVVAGDPMTETYEIVSGDRLSTLPGKLGLAVDWRLLQRVNAISDPNKIRLGQKIKLVRGPFHAVVDKSDYRLDLYAGPPEEEGAWVYIRSFRVGLGEGDST
ncbi:hypothetical protein MNBD_PLANCTO03-796, partial [hydrothermal vent metagenome]